MAGRDATDLASLRLLFHGGAVPGLTDGQLLERFVTRTGETGEMAFAALVERHGPMVLNTCQAVLRDEHAAQDAFQATFFVLARRARSLWVRDSLGPWLHRVARRAAKRALLAMVRRQAAERKAAEMTAHHSESDVDRGDLRRFLHEEIDRLPERHRVPVVLCDLEGRTYEDAARHLGCPVGTIKSRLARGRERLRERLVRRGVVVPAGLFGASLLAPTAVPAALIDPTVHAALRFAAQPTTGLVATSAPEVAEAILRMMFLNKVKACAATLLTLAAMFGLASIVTLKMPAWGNRDQRQGIAQQVAQASPRETGLRGLLTDVEWLLTSVDPSSRTISIDERAVPVGKNSFALVLPPGQSGQTVGIAPVQAVPGGLLFSGVRVQEDAAVTIGGKAADLASLRPGMRARLRLAPGRPVVAAVVVGATARPASAPSTYTLTAINSAPRTISVVDDQRHLTLNGLPVAPEPVIQLITTQVALRIQTLGFEDLKVGMPLSLELVAGDDGLPIVNAIYTGR